MNVDGVRTPSIIDVSFNGNLTFFDMDFVAGQTPYDLFLSCDKQTVDKILERLINYLKHNASTGRLCDGEEFKIKTKRKIQELMTKTKHPDLLDYLAHRTDMANFTVTKSFCHGDLTLSNMIYLNGDLYLIDFLDSFIDTTLIDIAKLKQDLFYDWTLDCHIQASKEQRLRIKQICRKIWNGIETRLSVDLSTEEFKIIEALNFLRIEPYTKNEQMRLKLDEIIKNLEIYEEFNSTNGREIY